MSEKVQQLFEDIAPRYDLLNSVLSLRTDRRWRKETVKILKNKRFVRVMDLCAGTLALTRALLEINPYTVVRAVDFSQAMLKKGLKDLPEHLRGRVEIGVADAMKMTPPAHSLDAVMCAYGMRNIEDNHLVLSRLRDALKPGGRLVVLEFFKPEGFLSRIFNATYAQVVIPILGRVVSGHPQAYRYLRDSVRGYFTPSAFCELLKSTGYVNIRAKALTGGVSHLITAEVPQ